MVGRLYDIVTMHESIQPFKQRKSLGSRQLVQGTDTKDLGWSHISIFVLDPALSSAVLTRVEDTTWEEIEEEIYNT